MFTYVYVCLHMFVGNYVHCVDWWKGEISVKRCAKNVIDATLMYVTTTARSRSYPEIHLQNLCSSQD